VLILAFDTATSVATSALVRGDEVLGERATTAPVRVLEDVDALLRGAGVEPRELDALAIGIGPGSFTGVRMGLAAARAVALSLEIRAAGVSTLAVLAAGAPGTVPLIDAKRRELFLQQEGEIVALPAAAFEAPGRVCVGDGAVRYREHLERTGASVPPDESELHVPRARFHAVLAEDFGAADELRPVYVRAPDADRMLA
jgi:tRNA threonylcarbamoyladenosine biosynthesis protein TsaB